MQPNQIYDVITNYAAQHESLQLTDDITIIDLLKDPASGNWHIYYNDILIASLTKQSFQLHRFIKYHKNTQLVQRTIDCLNTNLLQLQYEYCSIKSFTDL